MRRISTMQHPKTSNFPTIRVHPYTFLRYPLVMGTGNPWVFFTLSVPVSVFTRTHRAWVRIGTDMLKDTDRGTIPMDKGIDFNRFLYTHYIRYAIILQSSSDHVSPSLTSGREAPAFRSSSLTNPNLLQ